MISIKDLYTYEDSRRRYYLYLDDYYNKIILSLHNIQGIDVKYELSYHPYEPIIYADCNNSIYTLTIHNSFPDDLDNTEEWITFGKELIDIIDTHIEKVQKELVQKVQKQTWLFSEKSILWMIRKHSYMYLDDVEILSLLYYEFKENYLTKEEFELEIKEYVYKYSADSKDYIDTVLKQHQELIDNEYNAYLNSGQEELENDNEEVYLLDIDDCIIHCREKIMRKTTFTDEYIDLLTDQVMLDTWIFDREQIKNKIKEMNLNSTNYVAITHGYIRVYLYQDKKTLTKEEYDKEVLNYVILNSFLLKSFILEKIEKNKKLFDEYYTSYCRTEEHNYYKAINIARSSMLSLTR